MVMFKARARNVSGVTHSQFRPGLCHFGQSQAKHHHQSPSSPSQMELLLDLLDPPRRRAAPGARLVCETKAIDNPALVGPAPYAKRQWVKLRA
jgi:hypothetical protein